MPDQFDVRRKLDAAGEDLVDELKEQRLEGIELARERTKRLIRLKVGYYFDPVTREILRKVGSQFVFVRHDRRRTQRLTRAEAENGKMRLIQGGLFWDPDGNAVYQFRDGVYVLYSRDRRKNAKGSSPTGKERRKGAS
jgi:hypothetical protein